MPVRFGNVAAFSPPVDRMGTGLPLSLPLVTAAGEMAANACRELDALLWRR
jgi:hypothetical protein